MTGRTKRLADVSDDAIATAAATLAGAYLAAHQADLHRYKPEERKAIVSELYGWAVEAVAAEIGGQPPAVASSKLPI